MLEILSNNTGRSVEELSKDSDRMSCSLQNRLSSTASSTAS